MEAKKYDKNDSGSASELLLFEAIVIIIPYGGIVIKNHAIDV